MPSMHMKNRRNQILIDCCKPPIMSVGNWTESFYLNVGAGEMIALWLITCTVIAEDQTLIPSTHSGEQTMNFNSSSSGSVTLYWLRKALHKFPDTHTHTSKILSMNVMKVTNCFLIRFKVCSTRENTGLVLQSWLRTHGWGAHKLNMWTY